MNAWTPDGRGLSLRLPSLLKCPALTRGNRIPGTNTYETKLSNTIEESIYLRYGKQENNLKRIKQQFDNENVLPYEFGKPIQTSVNFDFC